MMRLLCVLVALRWGSASSENQVEIACVTGASGYLGVEVVAQLLDAGWVVRGTVRDPSDVAKTRELRALPGAAERLSLLPADLLGGAGAFEPCVDGAAALFHTASPFVTANITDAQAQLVRPALEGTTHAVSAALASPSVRRIIVTSSIAATMGRFTDKDGCFNEDDWNGSSKPDASDGLDAYRYSKLVAEREFWRLLDEHAATPGARVVTGATVLPAFIVGPPRTARADGESLRNMRQALEGEPPHRSDTPMCDVRDVARAHVAAFEKDPRPTARARAGEPERYIVSTEHAVKRTHLLNLLRKEYPDFDITAPDPDVSEPDALGPHIFCGYALPRLPNTSVRDPDVSLLDMARAMLDLGSAKPKALARAPDL